MNEKRSLEFTKWPSEDSPLALVLTFVVNREAGFIMLMMDKYTDRENNLYDSYTKGSGTSVRIDNYHSAIVYYGQYPDYGGKFLSAPYRDKKIGLTKSLERMITQVRRYAKDHHIEFTKEDIVQIRKFYREKIKEWRNEE